MDLFGQKHKAGGRAAKPGTAAASRRNASRKKQDADKVEKLRASNLPPVIMHLGTHPLTAPGRDGGNQKLKRYLLLGTRHVGLRPERAYQQEYAPE